MAHADAIDDRDDREEFVEGGQTEAELVDPCDEAGVRWNSSMLEGIVRGLEPQSEGE